MQRHQGVERWTIGIDPDTERSGVALIKSEIQGMELYSFSFFDLLAYVAQQHQAACAVGAKLVVYVEAGYLIGTVWHATRKDGYRTASAKGKSVGRNHQTARHIVEGLQRLGVAVLEVKPLKKIGGRKADARLFKMITGYTGRTNQETRDAGLIAYHYSIR